VQKYERIEWVRGEIEDTIHHWSHKVITGTLLSSSPRSTRRASYPQIAITLLSVFIILVAIFTIYGTSYYGTLTSNHNATATAQTRITLNIRDTAQAQSKATATARFNATTTAQANATATAAAVAMRNPYPPFKGKLVLDDSLHTNPGYWDGYIDFGTSACQFTQGSYHATEQKAGDFADCFANIDYTNFIFQVEMKIIQGDCGGIIFRADLATQKHFYYFRVCEDQTATLSRYVDKLTANAQILTRTTNISMKTGLNQSNLLAISAIGNTIRMYINHTQIASVQDNAYSHGNIAVVGEASPNATTVAFSNAKVWTIS
jgi:hypothetical protein